MKATTVEVSKKPLCAASALILYAYAEMKRPLDEFQATVGFNGNKKQRFVFVV